MKQILLDSSWCKADKAKHWDIYHHYREKDFENKIPTVTKSSLGKNADLLTEMQIYIDRMKVIPDAPEQELPAILNK